MARPVSARAKLRGRWVADLAAAGAAEVRLAWAEAAGLEDTTPPGRRGVTRGTMVRVFLRSQRLRRLYAVGVCRTAGPLLAKWHHTLLTILADVADGADQAGQHARGRSLREMVGVRANERVRLALGRLNVRVRAWCGDGGYAADAADAVDLNLAQAVVQAAAPGPFIGGGAFGCLQSVRLAVQRTDGVRAGAALMAAQCELLIGMTGPGWAFDPEWRTSTAVALAKQTYESEDFSLMPILADALQDAGCEHEDLLTHLRGPGPFGRGDWVLDTLTARREAAGGGS